MRLFVAVDVDRATREAAVRLRDDLRRRRPAVERALRWVEPHNLHLTLRFLGERQDGDALQAALAEPFAQPRFVLHWTTPAWLPPQGRPRVLHVAVGDGADGLRALAGEVTARLAALGIAPEARAFTAHLTLARVREGADPVVVRQLGALVPADPFAPAVEVEISAVVLYESRLSPKGPSYQARLRRTLD